MDIDAILAPERTVSSLRVSSKKRALELAAQHIVKNQPLLDIGEVYRGLIERERLGSTAIGGGVAIPHCRLTTCRAIVGGLFVFDEPIDFAAEDDKPVQIMFVLLVPQSESSEHLATLAMLAERFGREDYRSSLVNCRDNRELFDCAVRTLETPEVKSQRG